VLAKDKGHPRPHLPGASQRKAGNATLVAIMCNILQVYRKPSSPSTEISTVEVDRGLSV
jgi:hypothetical protein